MNGQRVLPNMETLETSQQSEQESPAVEQVDDGLMRTRLDYAQRCFANVQDLSRFMDQKAGYLLSAVSLLTFALGVVASTSFNTKAVTFVHDVLHTASLVSLLIYTLLAFLVIYFSTRAFRARHHRQQPQGDAPGLMFPLMLLDRVEHPAGTQAGEQAYLEQLNKVTVRGIMADYSNQIVEISAIYRQKQQQINRATNIFGLLSFSWIVTMLLLTSVLIIG